MIKTQIQLNIQETIRQIVHLDRVEEQFNVTNMELEQAYSDQKKMDKTMRKELKDIEKLEGLSTKTIFYKILGNKEKQLEKERQEYLELSLIEEDLTKTIDLLEYEASVLESKLGSKNDLTNQLESLKAKRESEIIQRDPALRKKLLDLSNKLEDKFHYKTELEEAIEVGAVCFNLTRQIIENLAKVRNWGQWSSPSRGRGMMNQMMRRDAMDRARNLSYQVKHHLNLFDKELKDVGRRITFDGDTSQFSKFSDFFFNNIITDWIVNNQLATAINSAVALRNNLSNLIEELKIEKDNTANQVDRLAQERDDILTR